MQFQPEESQDVKFINIDHPDSVQEPGPTSPPAPTPATETETEIEVETESYIPKVPATPVSFSNRIAAKNTTEEYFSPMFMKRQRESYGSFFAEGYDPFEEEGGPVRGKSRKRARISTSWRYTSRSPSASPEVEEPAATPSKNSIQEPRNQYAPAMADEGVQTMNVETDTITETTQTLDHNQTRIIEETETNGIAQAVHAEAPLEEQPQFKEPTVNALPPPQKQDDPVIPEIEQQRTAPDNIDEKLPSSPQLRPLPSEGLPLVSPLISKRSETFNHMHNDNVRDFGGPEFSAINSSESDIQIQADAKKEDLYDTSSLRLTNDHSNSDQTNHQTSTGVSGTEYGPSNMEAAFPPHEQGQFEAEEGTEQFFPPYDVAGPNPNAYSSADDYAVEQDRYVPHEMGDNMAQYNYPDPEQTVQHSNDWGTQSSMTYPDFEDSHQQPASHSPYPQVPPMPSMIRSQSHQSHHSFQSHQSPKSKLVDLTESSDEDEDAEGFPEVEDNNQPHMFSSRLPIDNEEEPFYDDNEEEEEGEGEEEEENEDNVYDDTRVDDYGEGYSDEEDENLDSRGRGEYFEDDEIGSENDYEEDYSEDGMDDDAPLQQQPPQKPEVIDLLSSDDEDEGAAETPVAQTRKNSDDDETVEAGDETEENEDEDFDEENEDEDYDEEEGEGEDHLEVVGEKAPNTAIPGTKSQEFVREASNESMENESTLVNDHDDTMKTDMKVPKMVLNTSEPTLDAHMEVDASLDKSKGALQSSLQGGFGKETAIKSESVEPVDIETSLASVSTTTDKIDIDNASDNLDKLFEKLEEAGPEMQLDQGPADSDGDELQDDADSGDNVEDVEIENIVQNSDEVNTKETPLKESEPTETTEDLPTAEKIPQSPILVDDNENTINAASKDSPPSPIAVEISNVPTISISEAQSIAERAAKSGWSNSLTPQKATLFSRTFSIDGANDTSDEGDKDNDGETSYPTLPVTEPEDLQELTDGQEQIPLSQDISQGIDVTTNHPKAQSPTPDDTQKIDLDDFDISMSDLLQSQLQEEMGEMDEDEYPEIRQTDESITKDLSEDSIENEDQISTEEINGYQDVAPDTEADNDDIEVIDPELEEFEVQVTKTEIIEVEKTEFVETEVDRVNEEPAEDDISTDEDKDTNKGGEFEDEKTELEQIEANIREAEITEFQTQQTLEKLVENNILGHDAGMAEIAQEYNEQTIERTESVVDETEAIILEQIRGAPPSSSPLRNRNRKEPSSPESKKSKKESTFISPRHTRSSKELSPSPDFKRSRKGSATVSPRQTRSKKLEPVVDSVPPVTPTKLNKENERPSTRGSNRSRRSPSIILDEEETPQGHDASAEMVLESLEFPESPTRRGHDASAQIALESLELLGSPTRAGHDASAELALETLEVPKSPTIAGHHLRAPATTDPKLRLNKYLRTDLSEYTTLKMLRYRLSNNLDILAIATSVPAEPQRSKSGPRHYTSTFTITDQTIAPSGVVEVRIFRPYKDALPTPEIGDGILLRDFSVQSVKGKGFALKSEDGSSWAVFKDEGTEVEVNGPPVEYGHSEKKHMNDLREWFHGLDDKQRAKLEKVSAAMVKDTPGKSTPDKGKK